MGITTEEIAKALNISRSTVSRALNGKANINKETRARILEAANKLGYKPNRAARSLVMQKKYVIGVVVYSEPQYFWKEVRQGIARAEQELADYGIEVRFIVTDIKRPEEQITAIKQLVDEEADAIVISPNDPEIMSDSIDEVTQMGIPVITISSDIPESTRLCYVGCDYVQSGRLAGELMGKLTGGKGKIAVLSFEAPVMSVRQKLIGFREVVGNYSNIDILGPYKLARTGENVYDFTARLIRENQDMAGIFMTYGKVEIVGQVLKDMGKHGEIKVIGYDLSDEIESLLKQDILHAMICQEPFSQGYYSIKILYNYLCENKKPSLSIVNTKLEAVFRENLNSYRRQENHYSIIYDI